MQTTLTMKKPVEWIHLVLQTVLVGLSLAAVLYTFATNQSETKSAIKTINERLDKADQQKHDDAVLYRADMSELKSEIRDLSNQLIEIKVSLEDKQNRKN